ncbi:MAG TPA: aminomethyl-transferring glycine dehydrogenase subunit GcvPA, partial [Atopobiaceae bacterium]|nr:aminomethyl-transferring glycine dehydrogenase subunit GcvPA [Atopobiaceae bacterium]
MAADERMLKELGIQSVDDLFSDIPASVRVDGIPLPDGMSEIEVVRTVRSMLSANVTAEDHPCFLGGGVYRRFIPAAVGAIISRSELLTSYMPYQAEISQGMLQALFEYQSFIAELTGMEAVNSSNYDASTALGEAANMCGRINEKERFLVPEALSAGKRGVLHNYTKGAGMQVIEYGFDPLTGELDLDDLASKADDDVSGIYLEVPNFLGVIDRNATEIKKRFPDALLVVGADPISLGVLKAPGDYGADIVIGEGQSLGSPMNFGGPLLGLFGCRQEHVRKMPGRIIGMTKDLEGRRAFAMTLQTREQHIRREKATSNICTNAGLCALAFSIHMTLLGERGLRDLAALNHAHAVKAAERLVKVPGVSLV